MSGKPSKAKVPHGAALQNSPYMSTVVFWLSKDPNMTATKIRKRLYDIYKKHLFSEPHIRAWINNYYKPLLKAADDDPRKRALLAATESVLFGDVQDTLDYHRRMVRQLETQIKSLLEDIDIIDKKILLLSKDPVEDGDKPLGLSDADVSGAKELTNLIRTKNQTNNVISKLSDSILKYKEYIDNFERVHQIGERMGDLLSELVESVYDQLIPLIPDRGRDEAVEAFDVQWKRIAIEYGVPSGLAK